MKTRRRYLISLLLGGLFCAGFFYAGVVLQVGARTESSRWCHEIVQRKRAAADAITGPKILIAGGSSALFSINARQIESKTGIPTVNMGTHAALGPQYILEQIKKAAKPGDTVLLALEYELYRGGAAGSYWDDEIYIDYLMARDPKYLQNLPWTERSFLMFSTSFVRLKHGLKARFFGERPRPEMGVYNSTLLNRWGDQTGCEAAHKPDCAARIAHPHSLLTGDFPGEPKGFVVISNFCAWARTNRVQVLATYPAIAANQRYGALDQCEVPRRIKEFYIQMEVPMVENAKDVVYPQSDFFDTVYHLTTEGALRRTEHFILAFDSLRRKEIVR